MTTHAYPGLTGSPAIETDEGGLLRLPVAAVSSWRLGHARELAVLAGALTAGIAVRLIQISQPFVDRWSSRQADVARSSTCRLRNG